MLTNIYYFDENGYFQTVGTAQVVKGEILLPNNATAVEPDLDVNNFYRFDGEKWIAEAKPMSAAYFVGKQISHQSQEPRDIEMRSLLQKFVAEDPDHYRVIRGTEAEGLYWSVEEIPQPTETELKIQAAETEIAQLKAKLNETDYVVAKIAEGVATKDEYADVLEDRQEWRVRINELEAEIQTLEA